MDFYKMFEQLTEELETDAPKTEARTRRLEKRWTAAEDKIFVELVEEREALWNSQSPLYKDRDVRYKCWEEVASKTNHSVADAKIHWNTVRSRFNLERKKELASKEENYKSAYDMYGSLQFLLKVMTASPAEAAIKNHERLPAIPKPSVNSTRPREPRKLEKLWTASEDKILVEMMEEREALWNYNSAKYRNRNLRNRSWLEIAAKTSHSVADAKIHWNTVKSRFNLERRNELESKNKSGASNFKSKYVLYEPLQFLLKVGSTPQRRNVTNLEPLDSESTLDDTYVAKSEDSIVSTLKAKKQKRMLPQTAPTPKHQKHDVLVNGISSFLRRQQELKSRDKWKKVFSEYILCELDRYEYNDAQDLKNQLNLVCLNFRPAQQITERVEEESSMQFEYGDLPEVEEPSIESLIKSESPDTSL